VPVPELQEAPFASVEYTHCKVAGSQPTNDWHGAALMRLAGRA
jgi:hypothetical protein